MDELKKEAIAACNTRGHVMYSWYDFDQYTARSACVHCGKDVQVNLHPAPNEIAIGGPAVALGCAD